MKSNRNRAFLKDSPTPEKNDYFSVTRILPNMIAIAILVAAYWYLYTHYMFPDYINYIYWAVNILVTYNIIAAAARSFLSPILTLALAAFVFFSQSPYIVLTPYELYQLVGVGILALIVSVLLKL